MNKRPIDMKRITNSTLAKEFINEQVELVKKQVKDGKVLLALSGGVDSSVVAALLAKIWFVFMLIMDYFEKMNQRKLLKYLRINLMLI